jgi:hypothetical protein
VSELGEMRELIEKTLNVACMALVPGGNNLYSKGQVHARSFINLFTALLLRDFHCSDRVARRRNPVHALWQRRQSDTRRRAYWSLLGDGI